MVETPPFEADKTSIDLLKSQIKYMQGYASFLEQRIEYELSKKGCKINLWQI